MYVVLLLSAAGVHEAIGPFTLSSHAREWIRAHRAALSAEQTYRIMKLTP